MQRTITVKRRSQSKGERHRMGNSKYGIKPSFILTVDESFTLLRETNVISRVIFFFYFFFGPYFQNFKSMKEEQSGHLSEEARREARHANRPYHRNPSSPRRGPRSWTVCSIRTSSSRLSAGIIAHPPSFGVSLSKLSEQSFCSGK